MVKAVNGHYRDGRVELDELPGGVEASRVVVVFLAEEPSPPKTSPEREAALARLRSQMEEGLDLGGPPYPRREELYDRFR
jgi:hypothetical protein